MTEVQVIGLFNITRLLFDWQFFLASSQFVKSGTNWQKNETNWFGQI
jgi:hypothetical protein